MAAEKSGMKSMTGYGKGQTALSGGIVTVEIKSVNSRFFDCTVKTPRLYGYLEERVKNRLSGVISRGKVDVYVGIDLSESENVVISLNRPLVEAYLGAFSALEKEYGLKNAVGVSELSRLPDVFTVKKPEQDADGLTAAVFAALDAAAEEFGAMRRTEGARMAADIESRAAALAGMTSTVEENAPRLVSEYRARLEARIHELIGGAADETRIITETAIYADKIAVDEETVRLRSHLSQLSVMLASAEPVGRKLDFLVQEMNREVNTIGSKTNDASLARLVVDMKSELEKIREQVQNIE